MEPAMVLALLWVFFGVLHIGLTTAAVRGWLVSRLGELWFRLLYSIIALATFSFVIVYYAQHRHEGVPGLALGSVGAVRPILIAVIVLSIAMMVGSFATYSDSPYAMLGEGGFPPPRGLERVSRHPFFAGLVMFSIAHALLATHLVGTAFTAGIGAVALIGMAHQDRKLKARYGAAFDQYLETTSAVPFAAILVGRQRLQWREVSGFYLGAGIALAITLRAVHSSLFAHDGAPFVVGTIASLALIFVQGLAHKKAQTREQVDWPLAGERRA